MRHGRGNAAFLTCALLFCTTGSAALAADKVATRKLRIESQPAGAEVLGIGGSIGYTPLTVNERVIYPNSYPDDRADLYGMVLLRRTGCETYRHRVTLEDLEQGLSIALDCAAGTVPAAQEAEEERPPQRAASAPQTSATDESVSERRLRQLQVLQELLDEGLISVAEERRIRRQLLDAP